METHRAVGRDSYGRSVRLMRSQLRAMPSAYTRLEACPLTHEPVSDSLPPDLPGAAPHFPGELFPQIPYSADQDCGSSLSP
jgi:hypothetical protein